MCVEDPGPGEQSQPGLAEVRAQADRVKMRLSRSYVFPTTVLTWGINDSHWRADIVQFVNAN